MLFRRDPTGKLQVISMHTALVMMDHQTILACQASVGPYLSPRKAGLPINLRTGFPVSVKFGKAANELDEQSWDSFYSQLCSELRVKHPDLYESIFGEGDSPTDTE